MKITTTIIDKSDAVHKDVQESSAVGVSNLADAMNLNMSAADIPSLSSNISEQSVLEQIREKVNNRHAMQDEIYKAGKPLFNKIREEYEEKLMLAIQTHQATHNAELLEKFGTKEEWEKQEAIIDADNGRYCPICGAHEQYRKPLNDCSKWLGIGESEDCKCGAGYEHHHPQRKRPLSEQSISTLLDTAQHVESAYANENLPMTYEQIAMNRSYFRRIINAIDSAKHNHFSDRFLKCLEYRRYSERYDEMLELMVKVEGGGVARGYVKYGDPPRDLAELDEMISKFELELTAKTVLLN